MSNDIVDLYLKYKDFEKAVQLSGLPTLIAHLKLLKSGVLEIDDKIKYGSEGGKLGALAEQKFQKMIPEAINYNTIVKKNNPIFDFKYGDLTIDVKYSSLHKRGNTKYWQVRPSKADLIVIYLESKAGRKLDSPEILVIPQAFIYTKSTLFVTPRNELYTNFLVQEEDLKFILSEYNGVFN